MREPASNLAIPALPEIPRKRYFAIGEVSDLCMVKPHVLRYWEQEFPQLKPVKRRGNRRYYQHDDVLMIRRIRSLLYEQGFTIGGARQRLKELPKIGAPLAAGMPPRAQLGAIAPLQPQAIPPPRIKASKAELAQMRSELESALKLLAK
ncbi:MAG TPA: MerR family transcriptional regulator [Candidatus Binatia bacterium]|nr:MerR family transcriptional regulator [Candidatus Binatia bacterium]